MKALNEQDLLVVKWIQEARSCTVSTAKTIFRNYAKVLADPDAENRHEIVWSNFRRAEKLPEPDLDAAPLEQPQQAEQETEQTTMSPEATKKKAKKKAAKSKTKAAKKPSTAREPMELTPLVRDVELLPANGLRGVYTANLFSNRKHAVLFTEYDNPKKSGRIGLNPFIKTRIATAKKFAQENDLPLAYCASGLQGGEQKVGLAVPEDVFKKFSSEMSRERVVMSLSPKARAAYKEGGWDDVKFSVAKIEEAAAA
jgi:hypothetical protein